MQAHLARSDYLQAATAATFCGVGAGLAILASWAILRDGSLFSMPASWLYALASATALSGAIAAGLCLRKAKYERILNRMVDELRD
jgi:hypothetical protein